MQEIPKRIERMVREWAGVAHERDLRDALKDLQGQFERWDRVEWHYIAWRETLRLTQ